MDKKLVITNPILNPKERKYGLRTNKGDIQYYSIKKFSYCHYHLHFNCSVKEAKLFDGVYKECTVDEHTTKTNPFTRIAEVKRLYDSCRNNDVYSELGEIDDEVILAMSDDVFDCYYSALFEQVEELNNIADGEEYFDRCMSRD